MNATEYLETVSEADKYSEDFHNAEANRIQNADDFLEGGPPSAPAHQSPNEATLSAWHPTLWQRFRTSGIGRKILGPTPIEQEMIGSGQGGLAGPPQGEHGILPILSQSPLGPGPESKLGKAILAYYIGSYAKSQPQRVKQIYQQLKEGDTRGAYGGMIEDFLGGTMMAGAAHGLYREFVPGTKTATPPKGGQDAIPKRSTEKIPVGQASGDSGGVGTREVVSHREEGVPGEEQGTAEPQAEVAGKEKVLLKRHEAEVHGSHAVQQIMAAYGLTRDEAVAAQAYSRNYYGLTKDLPDLQPGAVKPSKVLPKGIDYGAKRTAEQSGVKHGLSLTEADLPEVEAQIQKAGEDAAAAHKAGDEKAFTNAYGRQVYLGEVREGINRKGPNYDAYLKRAKPAKPSALPQEHQLMLDHEAASMDVPVEVASESDIYGGEHPFAKSLREGIATIDRKAGKILINPKELTAWLDSMPSTQRQHALRSLLSEEQIHLTADDKAAGDYWNSLSGLEQAIVKRRYGGELPDKLWGHEALRFRMQQLARMTPREIAEASGTERWTMHALTALESVIRTVREKLGTKASREASAILDRMMDNLRIGKLAASGASPSAIRKETNDTAEREIGNLLANARMYEESGDAQSAAELRKMAERLRQQGQEEFFPMARPKKRPESLWQEKFILPGMDTQRAAGGTLAVPAGGGETAPVPAEARTSAEGAGALPRLTGAALEGRGVEWVRGEVSNALKAITEGKTGSLPSFKDFAAYMKKQQAELKPGQLHELWAGTIGKVLENARGDELAGLVKSVWGRQTIEAASEGKKSFFRGVVSGSQNILDKPPEGGFKLEYVSDRTPAELRQDERRAAGMVRQRERVIGALYNKLVKPVMADVNFSAKTTTPDDLRYGGGKQISAVQEFDVNAERNPDKLGKSLVHEARRSGNDPVTATKRLTSIMDRKSGEVYLVDTYWHPGRKEAMLLDPLSPQRQHTPLASMLKRYRVFGSVLRDQPVQGFKEYFKSLSDYNETFGNEARRRYQQETSYEPTAMSAEQFISETPGRIVGGSGGMYQGPHRELVEEAGQGELEKSEHTPMTVPEAQAMIDHVFNEQGTIDSADDVREAMLSLKTSTNRQALSGFTKLAKTIQRQNPNATADELLRLVAQRVYENHTNAQSLEEFTRRTMGQSRAETGETPESEIYPLARRKTPAQQYRDQARDLGDQLFQLNTQSQADVEDAFPVIREIRKEYDNLPAMAPEKVFRKIEEEVVTGHSDVKLSPNEQKLYERAAALHAENQEMYQKLRDLEIPVSEQTIFPRMAKDVNSIFARIVRGVKRSVTEGTVLSKSAWFTKHRVIKALVDDAGNRRVGAIVGGDKGGKFIAYDQGKSQDMGPFAWSDIVKRQELLEKELEPILKEAEELENERSILTRTEAREAVSKARIKHINERLAQLWNEANDIQDNYPDEQLDNKVWVDRNNKQWRVTDATTAEIERNMDVRYYKEPFSVLTAQNLKLKQMLRSAEWLEKFKTTPQFNQIARRFDERNIPPTWKRTELPQLRNFVFEPRTADVLNQFHERSKGQSPNLLTSLNRLLMNAVFFDNPFLHSPNLAGWWMTSRGAWAWMNPLAYPTMMRTGLKAFHDTVTKSPEYVNYLRAGAPLQMTRAREFTRNITQMLQKELDENPPLAKRIGNFLGYANPIKLSQSIGHAATAGLHDILTLQLIYEAQLRDPSLKPHDAIRKIAAVMPDYRVPARVLGSRWVSKVMTNPNAIWFGAYHYSEGKAFSNMAKDVLGRGDMSRAEALDKIAATALLMAVAYPALDEIMKQVTGRKDLMFRRAGSTTMPTAVGDLLAGRRTPEQIAPSFVSPAAATVAGISLFFNKNLMFGGRGLPVYNWREGPVESGRRVAGFAAQSLNPMQVYRDLSSGRYDWDQIFENMAGIRKDYSSESGTQVYGWAYDWAKRTGNQRLLNQFQQRSMEVFPPSQYSTLKNYLADGKNRQAMMEVRKLMQSGKTSEEIERELRPSIHPLSGLKETEQAFQESLSPTQLKAYDEVMARREKVYRNYLEMMGQ